jgi:predicted Zn-dependent peptidase
VARREGRIGEKDFSVKSILDRIESVKPEEIMKMANDMFIDEALSLAVISPIKDDKDIKKALRI